MKIRHLGIKGKCYNFLLKAYTYLPKLVQRLKDFYLNHFSISKVFVKVVPSHQLVY